MAIIKPTLSQAAINYSNPLSKGLVGCWLMNEGGGSLAFDIASRRNGTFTSGPVWVMGKNGTSISFDGVDDYLQVGSPGLLSLTGEMSIVALIKPSSVAAGTKCIASHTNSVGNHFQWEFEINRTAGKLSFIQGSASTFIGTANTALSANTWYHVAAVRKGSTGSWTINFYVDGKADGSPTGTADPGNTGTVRLAGETIVGGRTFPGLIDHILIYSRALSSQEVRALYVDPYRFLKKHIYFSDLGFVATAQGGITADLSYTLGSLTSSADATHPVVGDEASTLGTLTSSSGATHPVVGDSSNTLGTLTSSADASHPVVGDASNTLGTLTSSSDATHPVIGTVSSTLGTLTSSSDASHPVVADASNTLGTLTPSSGATHPVVGDESSTLGTLTSSSDASHPVIADASNTLGTLTCVASIGQIISGDLSSTLGTLTSSSTTLVIVTGDESKTLGTLTSNSSALVIVTGDESSTLGTLTVSSGATHPVVADDSSTLGSLTSTASYSFPVLGDLSKSLGSLSLYSFIGANVTSANLYVTLRTSITDQSKRTTITSQSKRSSITSAQLRTQLLKV